MRHLLTCAIIGSLALATIFAGCDSNPDNASTPSGPWSATVTSSGGVTGGGGAATIDSDGVLSGKSWATAGEQPVSAKSKQVPEQELAILLKAISDPDLQSAPPGQPQNMTTQLSVEMNGKTKKWIDNGQSDTLTRAIATFHSAVSAAE